MNSVRLAKSFGYSGDSIAESLLNFHFHETCHAGQMTMIVEQFGRNAKYPSA